MLTGAACVQQGGRKWIRGSGLGMHELQTSPCLPQEQRSASVTDVFISNCPKMLRTPLILLVGCLQLLLAKLVGSRG